MTYLKNNNIWDIFNDPFFIGYNRQIAQMDKVHQQSINQSFPPYNIAKWDEDNYMIEIALAGYLKEDLDVSVEDQTLIIKGRTPEPGDSQWQMLHQGIAQRKFTRTFSLAEHIDVEDVFFHEGVLGINLKRNIPEEKKPRQIKIQDV